MSITTNSLRAEYGAITEACGLLDRSERGKLALTGAGAAEFLQGQVTNDVEGLEPGAGCYAAFLTPKGKMLGDLRILDAGNELLLDTERVALQELFNMIRRFRVGYDVEVHKRTLERGLLSLIGPDAAAVGRARELPEEEHAHQAGELAGVQVRWIRTDVGVDVLVEEPAAIGDVTVALCDAGAVLVSEPTVEILRVERGRPRYGLDLDDSVIPQEAGLNARAVSFTKGCYVGQETVARLHYRGKPNRTLRGLSLSVPAHPGDELTLGERTVGRLGTVAVSPRFGPIAIALIRREAENGAVVTVGEERADATVVELPFR
ncbi:MAG TPA: glycine cleavage T C-terminal barrel domain-containing protein [Solirubrobacteraceae bacterium]|jgi:folate-binding protein YgfZ|nr:glycine cleavage T C-terminal barrel domain-containing protein [Solirubrobacteraceae bacterium]